MYAIVFSYILFLFQALTVTQIKKVQALIEEANDRCTAEMKECEAVRHFHLIQIGNLLHPRVPISDDEVGVRVCVYVLMYQPLPLQPCFPGQGVRCPQTTDSTWS